MKKKIMYAMAAFGIGFSGCSDFKDLNVNPEAIGSEIMDYTLLFTNVEQYAYGTEYEAWRNGLIYISTMIQHTASVQNYWNGDKYTYSAGYNSAFWDRIYPNGIRDVVDLMQNWQDNEAYYTEYQMARILRVLLFHRMTDLYGDVPYFEAGLAYYEQTGYPRYDTQQAIYLDMLNELNEAATNLEGRSSTIGSADIIYQGDVPSWQRFAYSLMLRLGMRLSKVDQETARTWVNTAVTGGIFTSNGQSALIEHPNATTSNNSCEPFGKVYAHEDPNAYRMSESFVNLLRNTDDPRLAYIATIVEDPAQQIGSGNWQMGDTTAANQLGMPNGYDQTTAGATNIANYPLYPGAMNRYSVANRYTYARIDAPTFLVTHAENQLLLAEAAYRGWISGSAQGYYEAGVTAAMQQFQLFGITGISEAAIQQYLANNPYDAATALEQINTQYYINTFSDEYESFANWRRSGYPELTPVVYIGNATGGTIPRRFTYPAEEATINGANYLEAVGNLSGGDRMTSRVWWDNE